MCPYIIIAVSVNGYVLFTGFHKFTPVLTHYIIKSTIGITTLMMTYWNIIAVRMDIDWFMIQLSTMMSAEKNWETNCRTRHVIGDDNVSHKYRPRLLHPAPHRHWIRSRCWADHHSYKSIDCSHQREKLHWTKCIAGNNDDDHKYMFRPYQWEKSNAFPKSQFSAIISQWTNTPWRNLSSSSAIPWTGGEVQRWLCVSAWCIHTTLVILKKPWRQQY
jgi:hypothetical protein